MQCTPRSLEKIGFESIRRHALGEVGTPPGRDWVERLAPLSVPHVLSERLAQGVELQRLLQSGESVPLERLEEIRDDLRKVKAEGSILSLQALGEIRRHTAAARQLRTWLVRQSEALPSYAEVAGAMHELKSLEKAISTAVTENGELRDDASPELRTLRNRMRRTRQELRGVLDRMLRKLRSNGMAPDEGPTIRNGRLVLPVLAEHKRRLDGMLHDVSATGRTAYIEPAAAVALNNDVRQLEVEEAREIERILRELTNRVRAEIPHLLDNEHAIGQVDGLRALQRAGSHWSGSFPMRSTDGSIRLMGARNPHLLLRAASAEVEARLRAFSQSAKPAEAPEPVVPLDLELEPGERALIITGPNAGGKSVAMKTVGLLCAMHQCGFPLPLHPDSSLPVLAGLFVDIGDEQSIENDLSTFSSRLRWMRETLQAIEAPSGHPDPAGCLVLIDEAGTGTDPEEGGALFQAFIERSVARGARVLATTHHGSLKVYAHTTPGIVNGAMEFDQEHLNPTYVFRKGIPGSSYAFEIAARMALPGDLLARAKQIIGAHSDKMGALLVDLEKRLAEAEQARETYRGLKEEAARSRKEFEERSTELRQKRREKLEEAYREAENILQSANRRIEQAVETIVQQGRVDRTQVKQVRSQVREERRKVARKRESLESSRKANRKVTPDMLPPVGSTVRLVGSKMEGELQEVGERHAVVTVNGLRFKTPLDGIVLPKPDRKPTKDKKTTGKEVAKENAAKGEPRGKQPKKGGAKNGAENGAKTAKPKPVKAKGGGVTVQADLSVRPSLDIRGFRGEEAVRELTLYLDKALVRGLPSVEIIHGTGEGVLRERVAGALRERKEVAEFAPASWDSGGPGKTVVKLTGG